MKKRRAIGHITLWTAALLGVLAIFTGLQRKMIYFPAVAEPQALEQHAARLGLTPWLDDDGDGIGWRAATPGTQGRRMLVFHGNAGFALDRSYYIAGLEALRQDWDVVLFEYPGYGARAGVPSEAAIKSAAERAVESLFREDSRPLYLLGESLGSGVASHLAAEFPDRVAGLLLVTPFTSLTDVAAHHFRLLPVRSLLRERYDSGKALAGYAGPAAFLLAGADEVVPTSLGQRLYDSYQGPKWLRVIDGAGHNSLPMYPGASWWGEASGFLLAPP